MGSGIDFEDEGVLAQIESGDLFDGSPLGIFVAKSLAAALKEGDWGVASAAVNAGVRGDMAISTGGHSFGVYCIMKHCVRTLEELIGRGYQGRCRHPKSKRTLVHLAVKSGWSGEGLLVLGTLPDTEWLWNAPDRDGRTASEELAASLAKRSQGRGVDLGVWELALRQGAKPPADYPFL